MVCAGRGLPGEEGVFEVYVRLGTGARMLPRSRAAVGEAGEALVELEEVCGMTASEREEVYVIVMEEVCAMRVWETEEVCLMRA